MHMHGKLEPSFLFLEKNKCLFIGCSLTDPNIRRLIRMAEKERKKHFAIINKVQLINVNS